MISPDKLKKASAKVEEDNWILRSFLKGRDTKEIDNLVNNWHKELFADYNCTACLNCCKDIVPIVKEKEIKAISFRLGLSEEEFKGKYLVHTEEGFTLKEKPCSFLTENGCSIYECRPADCREYPFTDKKQIQTRLINLVNNCETCPVVFEIFERLKAHYGEEFVEYKEDTGDYGGVIIIPLPVSRFQVWLKVRLKSAEMLLALVEAGKNTRSVVVGKIDSPENIRREWRGNVLIGSASPEKRGVLPVRKSMEPCDGKMIIKSKGFFNT